MGNQSVLYLRQRLRPFSSPRRQGERGVSSVCALAATQLHQVYANGPNHQRRDGDPYRQGE